MRVEQGAPEEPVLVGRGREQARLRERLARVAGGSGSAVLISGETGVGKTQLALHGLAAASRRGFLTLRGRSNPLTRNLSYGPIVEALARFLRDMEAPDRARLTTGLPALGQLIEGIDLTVPETLGDPSLEKTRLFESVLRLLDRTSRRAPLALLLDDLQWFDRSSLELLAYLAKDLPELPILLISTYRSEDEQETNSVLPGLLGTLRRAQITEEIRLEPLLDGEVAQLVAHSLEGTAPPKLVDWVVRQAAGIPLFAEALITALVDQGTLKQDGDRWVLGGALKTMPPPVVRDAVRDRLDRLDDHQRTLVGLVATGGGEVPLSVLEGTFDLPGLEQLLSSLVASGLLVERLTDEVLYAFAHPLILQVAYEELPGSERRKLHARFALAWEHRTPDELDRLAFHYRGALPDVETDRVIKVSLGAGERALDRYANAEALGHLQAALELASLHRPDLTARILIPLGEARYRTGDLIGAVEAWEDAIDRLEEQGSIETIGHLHKLAARALGEIDYDASDRQVEAGLSAMAGMDPSEDLLELLLIGAVNAHRRGESKPAADRARRIIEVAAQVGTERARILAVAAEVMALLDRNDYQGAWEALQAKGKLLAGGGPLLEIRGHTSGAAIAAAWGDLPTLRLFNRKAIEVVRRIGVPSGEIRVQLSAFLEAFYEGDWEQAREVTQETRLLAEALDHSPALLLAGLLRAMLDAFQGDFDQADQRLAEARAQIDLQRTSHRPMRDLADSISALVSLERGHISRALEQLHAKEFAAGPLPPWGLVVRGEAEAKGGRPSQALQTAEALRSLGPAGSYPDAMADRITGLAQDMLGDLEAAVERLGHASSSFDRLGLPFEAARAGIELAEVVVRAGSPDGDLAERVSRWYRVTSGLGAERYMGRARRLLHTLGSPLPPDRSEGELTARQLEVARLVAKGLTNAEIADQLFISVRTVHSHLDHIYTRLGMGSRAALAAWVTERRHTTPT